MGNVVIASCKLGAELSTPSTLRDLACCNAVASFGEGRQLRSARPSQGVTLSRTFSGLVCSRALGLFSFLISFFLDAIVFLLTANPVCELSTSL
jgi:hypothetical protein